MILVDGTGLIFRAYFALPSNLKTRQGLHTNAILGFSTMFHKLLQRRILAGHGAVVFDAGGVTYRHREFQDYKAQRPASSDELMQQLPWIERVVAAHGFRQIRLRDYEADDVIATLASQAREAGLEVWIVSSDKDFAQLVDEHVKLWEPIRDVVYDRELVRKKWGVYPEQFADFQALIGDKVDNIPGVPGIGPKGAQQLLDRFGTVEALLARVEELEGKNGRLLRDHQHEARLSKRLARLQRDVPLPLGVADLQLPGPDLEALNDLHRELEFFSLLRGGAKSEQAHAEAEREGGTHYADWDGEVPPSDRAVALQLCYSGLHHQAVIAGLALSWEPRQAVWLTAEQIPALAGWLADERIPKRVHDLRSHLVALWSRGFDLRGADDTRLLSYLCEPTRAMPHDVGHVVREYLQRTLALEEVRYATCQQADFVGQLWPPLMTRTRELGMDKLYRELELPLAEALARMQHDGVLVDRADLQQLGVELAARLQSLEEQVHGLAGHPFNLGSTKQLSTVLFEELKLPVIKKTKTGYSTDGEVLEKLADKHPIGALLLEHRTVAKLINTYTDVLSAAVWDQTGRVHAALQQTVSSTGRLISTDPDLQRTPVRTAEGQRIRRTFVAPPGTRLISADWSQIELRVLAHLSGDPLLVEAFETDQDIHRRTASGIFHVAEDQVTPAQREVAKTVNFATIYGQGASALSQSIKVPRKTAQEYIAQYFATYAEVRRWLDDTIADAHRHGYVTTLLGRRRWVPELSSRNPLERQAGERIAANTPVQGSAADLCKLAMLGIYRALREQKMATRMVMQIHDELVFEAPEHEVERATGLIRGHMTEAYKLRVPLKVNLGVGRNWAEAH